MNSQPSGGRANSLHEVDGPRGSDASDVAAALAAFKEIAWRELTPRERLRRSWASRSRLPNPREAHDRKLFPAP